eukprot:CAMPEP_0173442164 /NCGR_PEP_ID=MMETSP1357-20121228/25699_1 /TAXON_ID=77926 /ORGANISM="Hemiselmis rufescens, Strain PCC563" /LENGTH=42 /DNA_ID= /DNA_START= /DNA_END= /DNA_ORIENTATION=
MAGRRSAEEPLPRATGALGVTRLVVDPRVVAAAANEVERDAF